jgi:vitamin B12 transporter
VRYSNAANTEYLAGYTLVNLHAQTLVGKEWTLLLRVDNATDANYQLVKDYLTPGRTLYIGMRWASQ